MPFRGSVTDNSWYADSGPSWRNLRSVMRWRPPSRRNRSNPWDSRVGRMEDTACEVESRPAQIPRVWYIYFLIILDE